MIPERLEDERYRRYEDLRASLERIRQEFLNVSSAIPNLCHRLYFAPAEPLEEDRWSAFAEANREASQWQDWQPNSNGSTCGCFFGEERYLLKFKQLAECGAAVLQAIQFHIESGEDIPEATQIRLKASLTGSQWLDALYGTADFNTIMVHCKAGFWGKGDASTEDDIPEMYAQGCGGKSYPLHPFFNEFVQDLFTTSAYAIELWLAPEDAVSVMGRMDELPIRLPAVPEEDFDLLPTFFSVQLDAAQVCDPGEPDKPSWNATSNQLWRGETVITEFKDAAEHQALILTAFESEGWPSTIADPFKMGEMSQAVRTGFIEKRRAAVNQLNKRQNAIHFESDGRGSGIRWKWK